MASSDNPFAGLLNTPLDSEAPQEAPNFSNYNDYLTHLQLLQATLVLAMKKLSMASVKSTKSPNDLVGEAEEALKSLTMALDDGFRKVREATNDQLSERRKAYHIHSLQGIVKRREMIYDEALRKEWKLLDEKEAGFKNWHVSVTPKPGGETWKNMEARMKGELAENDEKKAKFVKTYEIEWVVKTLQSQLAETKEYKRSNGINELVPKTPLRSGSYADYAGLS
ncbi:hypothetical protein BJ508DRAFT_330173 [Ascobolus immersus RN42]|uniref:Uncharacterized protein n=1 Tax=Ascobolus immersus RN42 TaxID=1160509 RepID=A0A3N4HUE5_ASCIM|nr:hypothetical protein BJ508DRAFT_330173 [Ascobolus immersus RN42]